MLSATDIGSTTSTAQECIDLVAAAEPAALAISYDSTTGACQYSTSIYSYYPRVGVQEPSFYLRTDNVTNNLSEPDCLTAQDAEYLIARLTFDDEQCAQVSEEMRALMQKKHLAWVSTYDSASGLCLATTSSVDPARYGAGRLADGTQYMLSRDKAIEAVDYGCAYEDFGKMTFGGTWYCYGVLDVAATPALIQDNQCEASLGRGFAAVKISETREYGYVYDLVPNLELGLVLQSGTSYEWWDGSAADDLPWESGSPDGWSMVYVLSDLTVTDIESSDDPLVCKSRATYMGYDPTAKFL